MLTSPAITGFASPPQIYRQYFTLAECRALDSSPLDTALGEISLLRVLLLRLLAEAQRRRLSIAQHISMLGGCSAAGLMLASLVRFQNRYFPPPSLLDQVLDDLDPNDL